MLAHASSHFSGTPLHIRRVHEVLAPMAYFGVTTFFVISGFLITMLLLREHTRRSRVDLGRFYGRRAARILPAVLFYITIVLWYLQE
jgi:peptidoglycan/LPS O-acetylase OafA/YrhL